jgi:hypothetical protein
VAFLVCVDFSVEVLCSGLVIACFASFYGLFKKQLWSLKLIMGLYFIQLIGIETPDFSFALSTGVKLPISVTFNELTVTLNLLAALVLWVSYSSLKSLKQG